MGSPGVPGLWRFKQEFLEHRSCFLVCDDTVDLSQKRAGPSRCYGCWSFPEPRATRLRGDAGRPEPPRKPSWVGSSPQAGQGLPGRAPSPLLEVLLPRRAGLRVAWQGTPLNSAPQPQAPSDLQPRWAFLPQLVTTPRRGPHVLP